MLESFHYNLIVKDFTTHLSGSGIPYLIAPGRSASYLVENLNRQADKQKISIPTLLPLDRSYSFALAQMGDRDIRYVLDPILDQFGHGVLHFLDDYAQSGSKISLITENLRSFHGLSADFEVMVGSQRNVGNNVNLFRVNPQVVGWLSRKFKS